MVTSAIAELTQTQTQHTMKIENVITFTQFSRSQNAHYEQTKWLQRPYRLTYKGAERIIRKEHPSANVTRIETLIRE